MTIETCPVTGVREVGDGIFVLGFTSASLSSALRPGQFLNIRTEEGIDPLLRRPFSAYRIAGSIVEIIFHVVGRGTSALSVKHAGDAIDVLGPLGVPFTTDGGAFETAVLIGGGLGVAPLPILTAALRKSGKRIITLLGGRTASVVVKDHLEDLQCATDDGSLGFHGTVVDLARNALGSQSPPRPKIFSCGPMPMLKAVAGYARASGIPCEVSLEGAMGCGFGICQGCPVQLAGEPLRYALMCKDGPVFDTRTILL